jgi:hypothetical protein
MLSTIHAVGEFVLHSQTSMNSECTELRDKQFQHLLNVVRGMKPSIEDAVIALKLLSAADLPPWTNDQKQTLATQVSSVTNATMNLTGSSMQQRSQLQFQLHMQNYLTAADWEELMKTGTTLMSRMSVIVTRCFGIGLLNPCEKSVVALVSLIVVASREARSSEAFYLHTQEFKRLMKRSGMPRPA